MSFFKKLANAADAYKNVIKDANSSFFNSVGVANASTKIASLKKELDLAKNELEKKQLEQSLRQAMLEFDHYIGENNKDTEAIEQSWDRIRRIIGTDTERSKHLYRKKVDTDCPLKIKGDQFELQVGGHLENEGCFVFYNGMLRSEADQGVDLVAYDKRKKVARYIQCKNWERKTLDSDDLVRILKKMMRSRITPTTVEIRRQQQEGWSNGVHFDDSIYYEIQYELIVPKWSSLTQEARANLDGFGSVKISNRVGPPSYMQTLCFNGHTLKSWFYFD